MDDVYRKLFSSEDNFKECFITEEIRNLVTISDKTRKYLNAVIISGKNTGSTILYKSMRDIGKNCAVMTCYDLEYAVKEDHIRSDLLKSGVCFIDYCVRECKNDDVVLVITSIRDPIEQKIAEFFLNLYSYTGKSIGDIEYECFEEGKIQDLIDLFNKKIPVLPGPTEHPIIRHTEITSLEFDKNEKYEIYQEKNIIYLFLRYDNIQNWEKIITKIPCFENFKLSMTTECEKIYTTLYKRFMENFSITQYQLDLVYDYYNKILRRFFKDEEIEIMKKRWKIKKFE